MALCRSLSRSSRPRDEDDGPGCHRDLELGRGQRGPGRIGRVLADGEVGGRRGPRPGPATAEQQRGLAAGDAHSSRRRRPAAGSRRHRARPRRWSPVARPARRPRVAARAAGRPASQDACRPNSSRRAVSSSAPMRATNSSSSIALFIASGGGAEVRAGRVVIVSGEHAATPRPCSPPSPHRWKRRRHRPGGCTRPWTPPRISSPGPAHGRHSDARRRHGISLGWLRSWPPSR